MEWTPLEKKKRIAKLLKNGGNDEVEPRFIAITRYLTRRFEFPPRIQLLYQPDEGCDTFLCSCRRHPCLLPSSIFSSSFSFYQVRGIELFRGMNRTNERESLHMAFSPINAPLVLRNFLFLQLKKEEKRKAPILSLRLHDP